MKSRVIKIGNSFGVTIPSKIVKSEKILKGDFIHLKVIKEVKS